MYFEQQPTVSQQTPLGQTVLILSFLILLNVKVPGCSILTNDPRDP